MIKNKLFIFLSIFLLITFIFSTNVFATSINYNGDTINVDFFKEDKSGFILYNQKENAYIYFSMWSNPGPLHGVHKDYLKYYCIDNGDSVTIGGVCHDIYTFDHYELYYFNIDTSTIGNLISTDSNHSTYTFSKNDYVCIYTPDEVYSDGTYSNLSTSNFFYQTPQGISQTLVEETMKAQIMEQMKVMIVGFLKYLIVLVISLIAFWKGWQFLSTQLKKA